VFGRRVVSAWERFVKPEHAGRLIGQARLAHQVVRAGDPALAGHQAAVAVGGHRSGHVGAGDLRAGDGFGARIAERAAVEQLALELVCTPPLYEGLVDLALHQIPRGLVDAPLRVGVRHQVTQRTAFHAHHLGGASLRERERVLDQQPIRQVGADLLGCGLRAVQADKGKLLLNHRNQRFEAIEFQRYGSGASALTGQCDGFSIGARATAGLLQFQGVDQLIGHLRALL